MDFIPVSVISPFVLIVNELEFALVKIEYNLKIKYSLRNG